MGRFQDKLLGHNTEIDEEMTGERKTRKMFELARKPIKNFVTLTAAKW